MSAPDPADTTPAPAPATPAPATPAPAARLGLRGMLRAGARDVADHAGTVLAVFAVQTLIATGAWFVMAQLLADAFARYPRFDRGVDGDLLALVEALGDARATVTALGWIGVGAVLSWIVTSWFLAGGLLTVLVERPRGRAATVRAFGAGGATHFFAMLRLTVLTLPLYALVFTVLGAGLGAVAPALDRAMTLERALGLLAAGVAPAALLLLGVWTLVDLARAELVARHVDGAGPRALIALGRAASLLLRRPAALGLALAWALAVAAVTLGYAWLTRDQAMFGAGGALTLWLLRQGVLLARMTGKVVVLGGLLALVRSRPAPAPASTAA